MSPEIHGEPVETTLIRLEAKIDQVLSRHEAKIDQVAVRQQEFMLTQREQAQNLSEMNVKLVELGGRQADTREDVMELKAVAGKRLSVVASWVAIAVASAAVILNPILSSMIGK